MNLDFKNHEHIKAILFDFDGVIFNSEPIHWEACNAIFNQIGFTVPYSQYLKKYVGLTDVEMFPLILIENGYQYQRDEIKNLIAQKIKAYENIIKSSTHLKSIPGLSEFLRFSHKTIPQLAICSGSTRFEIETTLSNLEKGSLKKYFDLIITSEDVTQGKPSPEGYLKTAHQLNVPPENCLVIEDTKNGILAAKNANMKVIGLATTHSIETLEKLAMADLAVSDYEKLMELIKSKA